MSVDLHTLPLTLQLQINDVCDRFEQGLRSGQNPRIEDYLTIAEEPGRTALFRELLNLELDYQSAAGQTLVMANYLQRFDSDRESIERVWQDWQRTTSSRYPALPASIGRFQIQAELGRGSFGVVYRAYDPTLDRLVALKVLRHYSPDIAVRFRTEARAAARLQHPNIVALFELGEANGTAYLSADYVDGSPLSKHIEPVTGDFRRIADWIQQLAEALAYAHSQQVIHRDIKPDNILIAADKRPKIADFGLAKRLDDAAGRTLANVVLGTPAYMAPQPVRFPLLWRVGESKKTEACQGQPETARPTSRT